KATRVTEFSDIIPVFDVYLGTTPSDMQLICSDTPTPWCPAGQLNCGTNYYWQVVAKSNCGQKTSDVWAFSTTLVGDYDHDCDVDMSDYALFASEWMNLDCDLTNNFCQGKDSDMLGTVDLNDFVIFLSHWLDNIQP
ncbi:unnamed protein product, partial [marine sediment metagenome]